MPKTIPHYLINPLHSDDEILPDVKFNRSQNQWQCCGQNPDDPTYPSCDAPIGNEFFNAPPPASLSTFANAASTTATRTPTASHSTRAPVSAKSTRTGTASRTPTGSARASGTRQPASQDEGSLSTGAQAGIGVGVGIAGLLLIGAVIFFLLRKRKAQKKSYDAVPTYEKDGGAGGLAEADGGIVTELPTEENHSKFGDPGVPQDIDGGQTSGERTVEGAKVHPINPGAPAELGEGSPTVGSPQSTLR